MSGHAHRPRRMRACIHLPGPVRRDVRGACSRLRSRHLRRGRGSHRQHREDDIRWSVRRRRHRAASSRHPVPDQDLARATVDPAGIRHVVRRSRSSNRSTGRVARGRQCDCFKSRRLDHPLPPGHPCIGRPRRISLGEGTQARDAESRGRRSRLQRGEGLLRGRCRPIRGRSWKPGARSREPEAGSRKPEGSAD